MKIKNGLLIIALLIGLYSLNAQDVTTVTATDKEISENLDLEAVASVFGESENLEDFEKRLNDPKTQISNLDLNEDGEVDYLRVIESAKGESHSVTIQAVIGKDKYQDVAVIDVKKDESGETQVQVIGDVEIYGPTYVIVPVYVHPPVITVWFWGPHYNPWRSPYYWGYYPPYYHPWHPHPTSRYRKNVHVHVNVNNSYNRTTVRTNKTSVERQNKSKQNVSNKKQSTGKPVQNDWKTDADKNGKKSNVKNNKTSAPSAKSKPMPASKPNSKPASRPVSMPKGKGKRR
jgi:hypothetical protein